MKIMSSNFNNPFSQMVILILLFVGLVVPFCSSLALISDSDSKSPTPPSYPESPILNKPPPLSPPPQTSFDYFMLSETWPTTFCMFDTCNYHPASPVNFTIHGLWPEKYNETNPPTNCTTNKKLIWKKVSLF